MPGKTARGTVRLAPEDLEFLGLIAEADGASRATALRRLIRHEARHLRLLGSSPVAKPAKRGPTEKTKIRAGVFRRIKTAHPDWGYERVAMESWEVLQEHVTGETVRNAYRQMNWEWPRGDRSR